MDLPPESPSKRRKTDFQTSRRTLATSTPFLNGSGSQKRSKNARLENASVSAIGSSREDSSSTSISTVQSAEENVRKNLNASTTTSGDFEESFLTSNLDESSFAGGELDYDAFFESLGTFRRAGKSWQLFKPLRDDHHIYTQLINCPTNSEEVAKKCAEFCQGEPATGLYLLTRFILDCAGYQKLNIDKIPLDDEFRGLLKKMDSTNQAEVYASNKFLFKETDRLATIMKMAVFNFIQKFTKFTAENGFLYDPHFTYFMMLPPMLCDSDMINLFYTGAFFSMKFVTAICMLRSDSEAEVDPHRKLTQEQLVILSTHLNLMTAKVSKICQDYYTGITEFRLAFLKELELWINYSPQTFIDHFQCWKILINYFLVDSIDRGSSSVRLATLSLFKKIILNERCVRYLKNKNDRFIEIIARHIAARFEDLNDDVLVKALDVYQSLSIHYLSIFESQQLYEPVIVLIGDNNYEIAKAAGNCLLSLLKREATNDMEVLISLVRIATNFHSERKHRVVEALIDSPLKCLQNWKLFLEFFEQDELKDIDETQVVSDILLEAVQQVLTGKAAIRRKNSREVPVLKENHQMVAENFIPKIRILLSKYRFHPMIMKNFLKIIMAIDVLELTDDHAKVLNSLVTGKSQLEGLFTVYEDIQFLNTIVDFILRFSKTEWTSSEYGTACVKWQKFHSEKLMEGILKKKDKTLILTESKKVSVLFNKFDMTDLLPWKYCFDTWDLLDNTESKNEYVYNMMQCCRHSLLWKLRKLGASVQPRASEQSAINSLMDQRSLLLGTLFNMLQHTKGDMKRNAWTEICQIFLKWAEHLENISKQKQPLQNSRALLKEDEQTMSLFFRVYDKNIVANEKLSRTDRRQYAIFISNLAIFGLYPVERIAVLFKYYDKMYEVYWDIIENHFELLQRTNKSLVPALVFHAIFAAYEDVLKKLGAIDKNTKQSMEILSLTKRYLSLPSVSSSSNTFLMLATKHVIHTKQTDFFRYVTSFVDFTSDEARKELLKNIRGSIPPRDLKNDDAAVHFINQLSTPVKQSHKKRPAASKQTPRKERPLDITTTPKKKAPPTAPADNSKKTPQKARLPKQKKGKQIQLTQSTETGSSDMSIHDTSDESDEFTSGLENLTLQSENRQ